MRWHRKWLNTVNFSPSGPVPEPAAVPLFPAVLLGEAPRGGQGRHCRLNASSQPFAAQPRFPPQCQCPGVLQESPFSRLVARH